MKWNESAVAKVKHSGYAQEIYGSWDIVWDQSGHNLVEFVAVRRHETAYVQYVPNAIERLPEEERRREVAWHIDFFDNALDFRSFVECKNDARLKKLVV